MFTAKPNQKPNQYTILKPNRDTRTSEQKKKPNKRVEGERYVMLEH